MSIIAGYSKTLGMIFLLSLVFTGSAAFSEGSEYVFHAGEKNGITVLTERNSPGPMGIPLPSGPEAMRILHNKAWLADTKGGRLCIGEKSVTSTASESVSVIKLSGIEWPGDIALETDGANAVKAIWAVNRKNQNILKIAPDGKILSTISASAASKAFINLTWIELSQSGLLFVGDRANNITVIFDESGKVVKERPWNENGFFVTHEDEIIEITRPDANSVWNLIIEKPLQSDSKPQSFPLGTSVDGVFNVWGVCDQKAVITLRPFDSPDVELQYVDLKTGKVERVGSLGRQPAMSRYLAFDEQGNLWRATENYDREIPVIRVIPLPILEKGSDG